MNNLPCWDLIRSLWKSENIKDLHFSSSFKWFNKLLRTDSISLFRLKVVWKIFAKYFERHTLLAYRVLYRTKVFFPLFFSVCVSSHHSVAVNRCSYLVNWMVPRDRSHYGMTDVHLKSRYLITPIGLSSGNRISALFIVGQLTTTQPRFPVLNSLGAPFQNSHVPNMSQH